MNIYTKARKNALLIMILTGLLILLTACGMTPDASSAADSEADTSKDKIVIGFSQVGAESDWRKAHTLSMTETFGKDSRYELIIDDAQQKQSNQITAIRTFIQQEVDYIVLAPVTESGWDTVLGEAKEANIPVIIVDRKVDAPQDLFTCWVGSDFYLEGCKVMEWFKSYCDAIGMEASDIYIVDIQGTYGSSAQLGRTKGLVDTADKYGWTIKASESGEYTQAKAREVMAKMLRTYNPINVVYCENDNEAFGVIEAIESAGGTVGNSIKYGQTMVLSFDGVSDQAKEYGRIGKISCIGECNPLHGPRVKRIIENIEAGIEPEKYEYVDEAVFSASTTVSHITVDHRTYMINEIN